MYVFSQPFFFFFNFFEILPNYIRNAILPFNLEKTNKKRNRRHGQRSNITTDSFETSV